MECALDTGLVPGEPVKWEEVAKRHEGQIEQLTRGILVLESEQRALSHCHEHLLEEMKWLRDCLSSHGLARPRHCSRGLRLLLADPQATQAILLYAGANASRQLSTCARFCLNGVARAMCHIVVEAMFPRRPEHIVSEFFCMMGRSHDFGNNTDGDNHFLSGPGSPSPLNRIALGLCRSPTLFGQGPPSTASQSSTGVSQGLVGLESLAFRSRDSQTLSGLGALSSASESVAFGTGRSRLGTEELQEDDEGHGEVPECDRTGAGTAMAEQHDEVEEWCGESSGGSAPVRQERASSPRPLLAADKPIPWSFQDAASLPPWQPPLTATEPRDKPLGKQAGVGIREAQQRCETAEVTGTGGRCSPLVEWECSGGLRPQHALAGAGSLEVQRGKVAQADGLVIQGSLQARLPCTQASADMPTADLRCKAVEADALIQGSPLARLQCAQASAEVPASELECKAVDTCGKESGCLPLTKPAESFGQRTGILLRLRGLRRMAGLNGVVGMLLCYPSGVERWEVMLPTGQVLRVRPENVEVLQTREPDEEVEVVQRLLQAGMLPYILRSLGLADVQHLRPVSRALLDEARKGGRVYVLGGRSGQQLLRSAECLDLSSLTWHQLPSMLQPRSGSASAVLNDCVYVCGGMDGSTALRSVERFSPSVGTWEAMPPMSLPRNFAAVAAMRNCILVCGGIISGVETDSVECFAAPVRGWRFLAPMARARAVPLAAVLLDRLYLCGGIADGEALDGVERLGFGAAHPRPPDVAGSRWEALARMGCRRAHAASAVHAGLLYACGGTERPAAWTAFGREAVEGATRSAERFCHFEGAWAELPPMSRRRAGAVGAAGASGRVLVCGGDMEDVTSVESFDPATGCWEPLPHLQQPQSLSAAVVASGWLYVLGGAGQVESISLETAVRRALPPVPEPRDFYSLAATPTARLSDALLPKGHRGEAAPRRQLGGV